MYSICEMQPLASSIDAMRMLRLVASFVSPPARRGNPSFWDILFVVVTAYSSSSIVDR